MSTPHPLDLPVPPAVTPSLRLSGPADLVAAVPHLLGFTPVDSLVVVALRRPAALPTRVEATLRLDLDDARGAYLPQFLQSMHDHGAHEVVVLVYPTAHRPPVTVDDLVDHVRASVNEAGAVLTDALIVVAEEGGWRYWSAVCGDERCCPVQGRHVRDDAPVVAEAVGRGLVAVASREDVVAELQSDVCQMRAVTHALRGRRRGRTDAWRRREVAFIDGVLARASGSLTAADRARMLMSLGDVRVRDALLTTRDVDAEHVRQTWIELVRSAPARLRAAPATLLAVSYLAQGGGVRASVALDVALEADPSYRLAWLLHQAVATACEPRGLVALLVQAAEVERGLRPPEELQPLQGSGAPG